MNIEIDAHGSYRSLNALRVQGTTLVEKIHSVLHPSFALVLLFTLIVKDSDVQ